MATTLDHTVGAVRIAPSESLARKERLINNFARVTQFLTWPIAFFAFHFIYNVHIRGRQNFKSLKNPFIIIANHISYYDSFMFRLILGAFTPHLPLRFMAVNKFNWRFLNFLASIGAIDFIYSLFGVFTIVPGLGISKNLEEAREIIKTGGNVVIYPEGKIFVGENGKSKPGAAGVGPFKKGAAVLQDETGVAVIPVSFRDCGGWIRRRICINVGGPMNILPGMSIDDITTSFHNTISSLYERT